jgi:hypothetical protein
MQLTSCDLISFDGVGLDEIRSHIFNEGFGQGRRDAKRLADHHALAGLIQQSLELLQAAVSPKLFSTEWPGFV